ncbi:MAG: hypothetical protein IPH84_20425 [Bacteroidales bacterium]|nr:hypothetical protein [Bacteroidales bacterium]
MKCEQFRDNLHTLFDSDSPGEDMLAHSKECKECDFMYREFLAFNLLIEKEREIEVPPYAETRMLSIISQRGGAKAPRSTLIWKPAIISLGVITAVLAGITIGYQGQKLSDTSNQFDNNLQEMRNELNVSDVVHEDVINFD